jgi:hypothetical protein
MVLDRGGKTSGIVVVTFMDGVMVEKSIMRVWGQIVGRMGC